MSGVTLAVSGGLAAAGYAANRMATNQQLRAQDRDAAAGILKQGELRRQANVDVSKTIAQAKANPANLAKNQQAEYAQYANALQRAKPTQSAAFTAQPGGSARYAQDVSKAIAGNQAFGDTQARSTSITDAPAITNMQQQQSIGDTANKLGILGDTSANINTLTQNKAASEQANPWLQALGTTLQGAASGYGSYAGSKPKVPAGWAQTPGGDLSYAEQVGAGF